MSTHAALELTSANWAQEVEGAEQPVLVDFWASWCAPCRAIAPVVESLAGEYAGRVKVGKLNVEDAPEVAERFGVEAIPTLLMFRGGRVVDQRIGGLPRPRLVEFVESNLAAEPAQV